MEKRNYKDVKWTNIYERIYSSFASRNSPEIVAVIVHKNYWLAVYTEINVTKYKTKNSTILSMQNL